MQFEDEEGASWPTALNADIGDPCRSREWSLVPLFLGEVVRVQAIASLGGTRGRRSSMEPMLDFLEVAVQRRPP
jgi:hypothetical protein